MSSGPGLPANPTPAYQFQGMGQADTGALTGAQNLPNYAQANYPQFQQTAQQVTSGAYGAPQIQGAGNTAIQSGNSLVPYATQTLQTAFDPQNAQYNAKFGQQQQQQQVNNAANGVSGTPYGAGTTNTADQNFNLDWQNAQLGRQQTGAGTAGSLLSSQNQGATTGAGLLQSIPQASLSALSTLNTAGGQATGVNQMTVQDLLAYLQGGTSATNAGTGQYSAEANASLGQQGINNAGLGGLGTLGGTLLTGGTSGLNSLSNLFGFA